MAERGLGMGPWRREGRPHTSPYASRGATLIWPSRRLPKPRPPPRDARSRLHPRSPDEVPGRLQIAIRAAASASERMLAALLRSCAVLAAWPAPARRGWPMGACDGFNGGTGRWDVYERRGSERWELP